MGWVTPQAMPNEEQATAGRAQAGAAAGAVAAVPPVGAGELAAVAAAVAQWVRHRGRLERPYAQSVGRPTCRARRAVCLASRARVVSVRVRVIVCV